MTMSTIGYGDLVPTSTISKLFTIIYALLSIGVFVAVVSKLVQIVLRQSHYIAVKGKQFASHHGIKHHSKKARGKLSSADDDTG